VYPMSDDSDKYLTLRGHGMKRCVRTLYLYKSIFIHTVGGIQRWSVMSCPKSDRLENRQ
jgi:hypothetical protein